MKSIYLSYVISTLLSVIIFFASTTVGSQLTVTTIDLATSTPEVVNYKLGDKVPVNYVKEIISQYATSTKAYEMERTIACESQYWNVQSKVISHGVREDSWGLAQINLYWNPSVSREQALDPEFAIKWMSDRWGKTKWYGWNRITDTCNPIYK